MDKTHLLFGFSRSGGPGGQNVNKVNTKTELRVRPEDLHGLSGRAMQRLVTMAGRRVDAQGALLLVSGNQRTQEANRRACVEKLRDLIAASLIEPKSRRKSKPSRGSKIRRLESKRLHSHRKSERRAVREV